MNFQPNRVDPIQFAGEEPTDFSEFVSASTEDEHPVSLTTYLLAAIAFLLTALVLAFSAGYWFNYY